MCFLILLSDDLNIQIKGHEHWSGVKSSISNLLGTAICKSRHISRAYVQEDLKNQKIQPKPTNQNPTKTQNQKKKNQKNKTPQTNNKNQSKAPPTLWWMMQENPTPSYKFSQSIIFSVVNEHLACFEKIATENQLLSTS